MKAKKRTSNSFYSYSTKRNLRQEEIAAYRRIALATIIVVGLIVGGYFLGVPLLANLGNVDTDDAAGQLGSADSIPPAAPSLNNLADQVNTNSLKITGTAESGATVVVKINDEDAFETIVDKDGFFEGSATLSGGENKIIAVAVDPAGNISRDSRQLTVTYDATPPSLVLLQNIPESSPEKNLTISGKTEPGSKVTVNQRVAIVNGDGVFTTTVQLQPGDNKIEIISTDSANNSNKIERTVSFNDPQASPSASPRN